MYLLPVYHIIYGIRTYALIIEIRGFGEMKEIFVEGQTPPEAYLGLLLELMENGDIVGCPSTTSCRRNAA